MSKNIVITGFIDEEIAKLVVKKVSKRDETSSNVVVRDCLSSKSMFGFQIDSSLAGALASVIGAALTMWQIKKNNSNQEKWSKKRIVNIMDDELLFHGVCNIEIDSIIGYENFANPGIQHCTVILKDSNKKINYKVTLFNDEDSYIMKIG